MRPSALNAASVRPRRARRGREAGARTPIGHGAGGRARLEGAPGRSGSGGGGNMARARWSGGLWRVPPAAW